MRISEERWPEYPQPMEVSLGERKKLLIEEPCTRDVTEGDRENTKGQNDKLRGIRTIALKDDGPSADSEYAVELIGVETMRPSRYQCQ